MIRWERDRHIKNTFNRFLDICADIPGVLFTILITRLRSYSSRAQKMNHGFKLQEAEKVTYSKADEAINTRAGDVVGKRQGDFWEEGKIYCREGKGGDGCDLWMVKQRGRHREINGSKVPESRTGRMWRRQQRDLEVSDVRKCDAQIIKGFMDYSLWKAEKAKKLWGCEKFFKTLHKVEERCGGWGGPDR